MKDIFEQNKDKIYKPIDNFLISLEEDEKMKIYRESGKKWTLPHKVLFEDQTRSRNKLEYEIIGFREPKKGEYYLSGAIVTGYKAPNNLTDRFLVVIPTFPE